MSRVVRVTGWVNVYQEVEASPRALFKTKAEADAYAATNNDFTTRIACVKVDGFQEVIENEGKKTEGLCGLCGEAMPPGEEMFNYHGFSGPCPTEGECPEKKK